MMNRIHNAKNPYQGDYKRVLCVCSAGILRSPTAAVVLAGEPFNFNTRAAGLDESFALIPVDDALLTWADEIVCMDAAQKVVLESMVEAAGLGLDVVCLNIPDDFEYRDKRLMRLIADRYARISEAA